MRPARTDIASAVHVWQELGGIGSNVELLAAAHDVWCGSGCDRGFECGFLHYSRVSPAPVGFRPAAFGYTRRTSELFGLMGGGGYRPGVSQAHQENLWDIVEWILSEAPHVLPGLSYSDWSRKPTESAAELCRYSVRDALQWMALWCGDRYDRQPAALRYIAFSTVVDDLLIPPLELIDGQFRLYERSGLDLAHELDYQGWGVHGTHAMLSMVRQYLLQCAEKISPFLHCSLNSGAGVWDAVVYRTHTANTVGAALVIEQVCDQVLPPTDLTWGWRVDAAICDALSMDLAKTAAVDVYSADAYQPTADERRTGVRDVGYHSVYLDLIEDLVVSGAPDCLVHFGQSGFLFVPLVERYSERRHGGRNPLRPAVRRRLQEVFGDSPVDPHIERAFEVSRRRL